MFCPRCGRAVNETSNFCGGCGISRAEIEKYMIKTEAAQPQPEVKTEPVTVSWESQPAAEPVKAEPAKAETEPSFAEKEIVAEAVKEAEESKAEQPQQTYTHTESTYTAQQNYAEPKYTQCPPQPAKAEKSENLSTVDFIWMMVISAIPVVGLIYLIVLAFSNDNMNKRSYARASLIMSIFASIISIVFVIGFMLSAM